MGQVADLMESKLPAILNGTNKVSSFFSGLLASSYRCGLAII
jgi:hypothetical protein